MNDLPFLALILTPAAVLAVSSIYLALRVRNIGTLLVAFGCVLSLLLGIAGNIVPTRQYAVFDGGGTDAGVMIDGGSTAMWLTYASLLPSFVIAAGLVVIARLLSRAGMGVPPNKSFERTREG
jgi:hypothetical protein